MANSGPDEGHKTYDPVISSRVNSAQLTRAFLKDGNTLRPVQRVGVLVISLMIIGWGVYGSADALDAKHTGSPLFVFLGIPSVSLIVIGLLAFTNALRFKKRKSST
jgi:hypothetical protein